MFGLFTKKFNSDFQLRSKLRKRKVNKLKITEESFLFQLTSKVKAATELSFRVSYASPFEMDKW